MPKRLSDDQYRQIITLWEQGHNKLQIANMLNMNFSTVQRIVERYGTTDVLEKRLDEYHTAHLRIVSALQSDNLQTDFHKAYAYILAMYLGDGHITRVRGKYRLDIALDNAYPNLIQQCFNALQLVFWENKVSLLKKEGCQYVDVWSNQLPYVFPQHGVGTKHSRPIVLESWQQRIFNAYPLEILRGLYQTDGSRFNNIVKGYIYPRYQFTNASDEIVRMFTAVCDTLNIHWTAKTRKGKTPQRPDIIDILISRRADVEYLDSVIGAKS
jgi:hypothetical protein